MRQSRGRPQLKGKTLSSRLSSCCMKADPLCSTVQTPFRIRILRKVDIDSSIAVRATDDRSVEMNFVWPKVSPVTDPLFLATPRKLL